MRTSRTTALGAAVALTGLVAVTACSGGNETPAPPPVAPPATSAAPPSEPVTSEAPLEAGQVVLDTPVDEADVKQCEVFTGRANLPATKTIVLGVRNKDNGSPERYFGNVEDWEYPQDLDTWKGYQWFGSGDSADGQSFRVEVLVVDLALAKKMHKAEDGWHAPDNPPGAVVAAHIDLHRTKGPGPAECS